MAAEGKTKRRRRSRAQWRSVFARFEASGLGVEAFCDREGVSVSSFRRWRGLLAPEASNFKSEAAPGRAGFVDAGLLGVGSGGRLELRLELGDGVVLHLTRG
jgi:hypothetical protein